MNALMGQLLPWLVLGGGVVVVLLVARYRGFAMGKRREKIQAAKETKKQATQLRREATINRQKAEKELDDARKKEADALAEIGASGSGTPMERLRDSVGRFRRRKQQE
jgi:hypothetical protein